jgi:carboxylesterase type B
MHHMTAWGGAKGPAPFAQAILQSPGYLPVVSNRQQEEVFQDFLDRLNVSTIQEARQLPSRELMAANRAQVQATPLYGGFTYGPAVDGGYVPGLPIHQMMLGKFDKGVRVMVGHNADEGLLFTSPFLQNTSAIEQDLIGTLPTLKGADKPLNYILNDLYPPVSNSSSQQTNYTNSIGRGAQAKGDIVILSNAYILNKAYANETYSYRFSVYPALHGQDVPYTFYNGPSPDVESPDVATILQGYITRFAMTGSPNGPGLPYFSKFGSNSTVQVINDTNRYPATDPTGNERNAYWSKVLYV